MNENEAYGEYVVARAEAWAVHDALITNGQVASKEDLYANAEYRAAVAREQAAWVRYLNLRKTERDAKTSGERISDRFTSLSDAFPGLDW